MKEEFRALGAVLIVPGQVVDEQGNQVRHHTQLQFQGVCEPMVTTRDGLAQLHVFLSQALATVNAMMVTAPSIAEQRERPMVVPASVIPNLPMPHGGN